MAAGHFYIEREARVYEKAGFKATNEPVVLEVPLSINLNGNKLATLACSPEGYRELAAGFLVSEGLLAGNDEIKSIRVERETVCIDLNKAVDLSSRSESRVINTCAGRGLQDDPISAPVPLPENDYRFSARNLLALIASLDETSYTFRRTGGVHSAALGYEDRLLIRYEDIGRHNAVDKVLGRAYLDTILPGDKCLVLSGRIAAEIVSKALRHGIPLILSRSAPTLRAVELAERSGMTIVGFARGERFNVYCHWNRIIP